MKVYIDYNTEKRKNAPNTFEKNFFKSMINSVYGKTTENLRKRISDKIVSNEKDFLKHFSKPTFISRKIFDKNYATIHEIKPVLKLNKPINFGFTVLAEMLFTDTDSLTYEIKLEDVYEEFLNTNICLI